MPYAFFYQEYTMTRFKRRMLIGTAVVGRRKGPFTTETSTESLNFAWPRGVISLSHIALPFPPDDPLYGQSPPGKANTIFLGQMAIQGERGLLKFASDWLLRLRYNPFYDFLENRVLEWLDDPKRGRL
jgi:hypothetical protein